MTSPVPSSQAANAARWSADDDAWRGYRRDPSGLVVDERVEKTLDLLLPARGGALLDVGCATGVLTRLIAERTSVARAVGVDFVLDASPPPAALEARAVDLDANELLPHGAALEARAVNLDADEPLPYPDAAFDVVTCLETLEHVHDTDHLVGELRRVLKPTGYAVVSVPRIDGLVTLAMLAAGLQPPAIECSLRRRYGAPDAPARVSGHVSHFTRRALTELLAANGLRIEAFAQAGIYRSWLLATSRPPAWKKAALWALSKAPFKQDVQIVRVRRG